ncbi:hypothetical protein MMC09_000523 [Bachmanniomyces sp. S44760]|nr:hypothetical protein [Bachmanniomyces sp. S44760]
MQKAFLRLVRPFCCHYNVIDNALHYRHLTIDSAIHRGIRQSVNRGNSNSTRPSKDHNVNGGFSRRYGPAYELPVQRNHGNGNSLTKGRFADSRTPNSREGERIRRPNHNAKQDEADMKESARLNAGRLNVRQRKYLRGGRDRRSNTAPARYGAFSTRKSTNHSVSPVTADTRRPVAGGHSRGHRSAPGSNELAHRAGSGNEQSHLTDRSRYFVEPPDSVQYTPFPTGTNARDEYRGAPKRLSMSSHTTPRKERRAQWMKEVLEVDESRIRKEQDERQEEEGTSQPRAMDVLTSAKEVEKGMRPGAVKKIPLALPYTTPASEFLYGTSVVKAALRSPRRKLYKLYIYDGENRDAQDQDATIRKMALALGVPVSHINRDWLRLMDKMSAGRPHNGYILEASPLARLPIKAFERVVGPGDPLTVQLDSQSREEEAVNGKNTNVTYSSTLQRYPFILMLDGILDPGNMGAILRTAYFLGVDAVAISKRNSAPFSPVTIKASAGACENMNLMSINTPGAFIDASQQNGWKFYGAMAPGQEVRRRHGFTTATIPDRLRKHPCVLMLGAEGEGLRLNLARKANYTVGIEGNRMGQNGVDSLNVSVAAGLLCEAFLRPFAMSVQTEHFEDSQRAKHAQDTSIEEHGRLEPDRDDEGYEVEEHQDRDEVVQAQADAPPQFSESEDRIF